MPNLVHLSTKLQLLINTEYTQEQAEVKFHPDNIVDIVVNITLSDGSVHKTSFADIVSLAQEKIEERIEKATNQLRFNG